MSLRIANAFKSLLRRSGYSDEAAKEIWKWYKPTRRNKKAVEKWHSKAKLIDINKTKLIIIDNRENNAEDNIVLA